MTVGLWNAVGYISQAVGLQTTSASSSAFICSLAVVVVPLLDFFFDGKKIKTKDLVALALSVLGVGLLELTDGASFTLNDAFTFIQPLAFGVGFWRMEKAIAKHPSSAKMLTAAQLLAVAGVSDLYCAATSFQTPFPDAAQITHWLTTPAVLGALLWTGLITTALTVFFETLSLKHISAGEATLLFSTEPIWGSLFAAATMGETFGVQGLAGAAVILFTCIWSSGGLDGLLNGATGLLPSKGGKGGGEKAELPGDAKGEFSRNDAALQTGGLGAAAALAASAGAVGPAASALASAGAVIEEIGESVGDAAAVVGSMEGLDVLRDVLGP